MQLSLNVCSSFAGSRLTRVEAVDKAKIPKEKVDEVYFGNVLTANVGQNPARQASMGAGLPNTVVCTTIGKVCASGMKAISLAAQTILCGTADVVVAGGMESMSNTPYYLPKMRGGNKFGNVECVDGVVKDGLWDVYNGYLMGNAAEATAEEHGFSRQEQDGYAIATYKKAIDASDKGLFKDEIVPVEIAGVRGKPGKVIDRDEELNNVSLLFGIME